MREKGDNQVNIDNEKKAGGEEKEGSATAQNEQVQKALERQFPNLIQLGKRPTTISLGGLLRKQLPEREHLVLPWLRQQESAMVFAAPGVGKSLFAMSLALSVAGGGKALGKWDAPRARRVLYVDGEMPTDDIQERAKLLMPSVGGDAEKMEKNLHILARQEQGGGRIFPDLSDEKGRETLLFLAKRGGAELIILDNLSTLTSFNDENAASDFNDIVKFLLRLKQEGIACLLVHHSNKCGESYRGSSKIATTFEAIIQLKEVDLKSTDIDGTTRFRLSWTKYRGKREGGTGMVLDFALAPVLSDDEDSGVKGGELRWLCSSGEDSEVELILEMVRSGDYGSQKEIAEALGIATGKMSGLKRKAILDKHITLEEWEEHLPGRGGKKKAGVKGGDISTDNYSGKSTEQAGNADY